MSWSWHLEYRIVLALSALDKGEHPIIYRDPLDNEQPEKGGEEWVTQATRVQALCHAMSGVRYYMRLWARAWVSSWRSVPGRRTDGWGFSPLDQIKTTNVKKLVPVWTLSSGMVEGHESPPIVNNGVMFLTTPQNQVLALNAKTGDMLWRYKKELPEDLTQLHPTNRGVGLLEDKVYLATVDCHVLALDAKTGKVV